MPVAFLSANPRLRTGPTRAAMVIMVRSPLVQAMWLLAGAAGVVNRKLSQKTTAQLPQYLPEEV